MKVAWHRVAVGRLVATVSLILVPALSWAQSAGELGVVTTLQGQATVARAVSAGALPLKFKDAVFDRDRINTAEHSIVKVLMGGKAIVTVRELSALTITEELGKTTINLEAGKIAVGVAKQQMKPGERLEVHTPNAVAAVRGTVFVVEVTRQGAQVGGGSLGAVTQVTTVSGEVAVSPRHDPANATLLSAFRAIGLAGVNVGQVRAVSALEMSRLVGSFATTRPGVDPRTGQAIIQQQQSQLAALAAALAPAEGSSSPPQGCTVSCQAPYVPPIVLPAVPPASSGNLLQNPGFETGTLAGWTASGAAAVIASLGPLTAPNGQFMALIHTGPGAVGGTTSRLSQSGLGGAGALFNVTVSYNFLSNEWPTQPLFFNDTFLATVTDRLGVTTELAREERDTAAFQPSPATLSAGGFTLAQGNGIGGWKTVSKMVPATGGGLDQLRFEVVDVGDTVFDTATLLDAAVVAVDPPLYFLQDGARLVTTGRDPLLDYRGGRETFDAALVVAPGSSASLGGPLLRATGTDLTVAFSLLSVLPGGTVVSSTPEPLVSLTGGTHALGTRVGIFDLAGSHTAVDPETGMPLATDTPLATGGGLLEADGATISTQQALRVDRALLEASAPLLRLTNHAGLTSAADAIALSGQSRLTSRGPLVALDMSRLVVATGALVNVAGGSVLTVTGPLLTLSNGSTLALLNGPLLSVSGGSRASIGGALVAFGGSGGNLLSVSNTLCGGPCALIGGIPVALANGATAANVSIGAGAIQNAGLGSVKLATPSTALLALSGAGSKVTVGAK